MASFISTVKRKLSAFLHLGNASSDESTEADTDMLSFEEGRPRKRIRAQTPMLRSSSPIQLSTPRLEPTDPILLPPSFSLSHDGPSSSEGAVIKDSEEPSELLRMISNDVLSRCLSYIATESDRFALQTTCTTFRRLSDSDEMLANIDVGGGWNLTQTLNIPAIINPHNVHAVERLNTDDKDKHGIITESDTSVTACNKLVKFAAAGNLDAVYMISMILCYCHENIKEGVALLRLARAAGHLRSTYALALILRDSSERESEYCLSIAAEKNYPPAWQEKLTAFEMRMKFGEDLDANQLIHYLDSPCLIRLLKRHYLECQRVRKNQTSHCWNNHCGRWAYRAVSSTPPRPRDQRGDINGLLEPINADDTTNGSFHNRPRAFSIESLLPQSPARTSKVDMNHLLSPLEKIRQCLEAKPLTSAQGLKVSRMKMCSSCRRAKYCSKLCQTFDWRSGRHKMECQFL